MPLPLFDLTDTAPIHVRAVLETTQILFASPRTWIKDDWARRPWQFLDDPNEKSNHCDILDPLACQYCLAGGLGAVLRENLVRSTPPSPLADACLIALCESTHLIDAYPTWTPSYTSPLSHVIVWNDMPERTWAQVDMLLHTAITLS